MVESRVKNLNESGVEVKKYVFSAESQIIQPVPEKVELRTVHLNSKNDPLRYHQK